MEQGAERLPGSLLLLRWWLPFLPSVLCKRTPGTGLTPFFFSATPDLLPAKVMARSDSHEKPVILGENNLY